MKTLPLLFCAAIFALLTSCVSRDTGNVRIGMTKEEVLKIMGKPEKEVHDGEKEALIYSLNRQRPEGSSFQTGTVRLGITTGSADQGRYGSVPADSPRHPFYRNDTTSLSQGVNTFAHTTHNPAPATERWAVILSNGKVETFGAGLSLNNYLPAATKPAISVLSVTPNQVIPGQRTTFTLTIGYTLGASMTHGAVEVAFRTGDKYEILGSKKVKDPAGQVEISVTVSARELRNTGKVTARARLLQDAKNKYDYVADHRWVIPITK